MKNKVAPPFKQCEFDIMYGQGISKAGDILDIATAAEIVKKSGAWYSYNEAKLGQGRENVKNIFVENPDMTSEIEGLIREYYKLDKSKNEAAMTEE